MKFSKPQEALCYTAMLAATLILAGMVQADPWQPWDALDNDSWIGPDACELYPTNSATTYKMQFMDNMPSDPKAKGMNSLKFRYQGVIEGHMYSTTMQGSFEMYNDGRNNNYSVIFLLVVIDNDTLPAGFSLTLDVEGSNQEELTLDSSDFIYYDQPGYDTGRPSGYYTETDPDTEELAYAFIADGTNWDFDNLSPRRGFSSGMLNLVVFTGLSLPSRGTTARVDYQFENLPATAVFALYGYDNFEQVVKFTNRAIKDNNNPDRRVSTFEVIVIPACGDVNHSYPTGDLSGDCRVNWSDLSIFAAHWLDNLCTGPHWCGGADLDESSQVDWSDFAIFAAHWLECTAPECN